MGNCLNYKLKIFFCWEFKYFIQSKNFFSKAYLAILQMCLNLIIWFFQNYSYFPIVC